MVGPPQGGVPVLPVPGQPAPMHAGEYVSPSMPGAVSFSFEKVTPPSLVYIQRDDALVFQGNTSLTGGDSLTLSLRLLLPTAPRAGQPDSAFSGAAPQPNTPGPADISTLTFVLALPSPGVTVTKTIQLAEGYLLSLAVISANATAFGQTYTSAYIGRGPVAGAAPTPALMLVADYPTSLIPVGWPGASIRQSAAAQGAISVVLVAQPGVNTDFIFTAATGLRTRVHSAYFSFSSSATVANRLAKIAIKDNVGNYLARVAPGTLQAASINGNYNYALGMGFSNITGLQLYAEAPLPDAYLFGGYTLRTEIENMGGGDQVSSIALFLETWVA